MTDYVVATIKPWNLSEFRRRVAGWPGNWHLLTEEDQLDLDWLCDLKPRFVFFPHWSWRVPNEVLTAVECVCFHMTDVPYGRGGSPLQNLIVRGHEVTKVSALRMVEAMDAGPVYVKRSMPLYGSAQEIFQRVSGVVFDMIEEIVRQELVPEEQQGEATVFARRHPEQSRMPEEGRLREVFDHIRMLDADSYPHAYMDHGNFRLEFTSATFDETELEARVHISLKGDDE
jgi:methionyl-tRNA formyltransferase